MDATDAYIKRTRVDFGEIYRLLSDPTPTEGTVTESKINWRAMSELPKQWDEGEIVLAGRNSVFGPILAWCPEAPEFVDQYDTAWCYASDLELPTEPVKPKLREPKAGEVWETSDGVRWLCDQNGGMASSDYRLRPSVEHWMERFSDEARCVLEAPGVECD